MCTCLYAICEEHIVIHSLSGHLLYNKLLAKFHTILDCLFNGVVNSTSTLMFMGEGWQFKTLLTVKWHQSENISEYLYI